MITIADTGPLLHLHWVDAATWALPRGEIMVVDEVWREVERHDKNVLKDARLRRVASPVVVPPEVAVWNLDGGEEAALCYALTQTELPLQILCDEARARKVCNVLSLPVIGSVGLMIESHQAGRVSQEIAVAALRELPVRGRMHIRTELIAQAIARIETLYGSNG